MKPLALLLAALAGVSSYQAEIVAWRQHREAALRAPGGWISLAGLFWLHPGANRFGTAPQGDIVLPAGPARAGEFEFDGRSVTLRMNGRSRPLRPDADTLTLGRLKLMVIRRGDRFGIRLKDPESPFRRDFHGLRWFPVREQYRLTARFVADPRPIPITNILGQTENSASPGYVVFTLDGQEYKLRPMAEGQNLFFVFRDRTAGRETYGSGRFLDADPPRDGSVILDFNKAYNPPCAFTPYATCPLPPRENRLPVRIEAGELKYEH